MEVHHPHHPSHKKKWTEYLLEFLMLFLAVFLGFLAENIRERAVERHKEKEYMSAMVQDLKSDTANFKLAAIRYTRNADRIDTLFNLLEGVDTSTNTSQIYYQARMILWTYYRLYYNDRTFEQLRSSGNLRLIRDATIADSITTYYQRLKYLDDSRDLLNTRHANLSEEMNLIFNSFVLQKMIQKFPYNIVPFPGNPPLMPHTPKELNKFLEALTLFYGLQLVQANSINDGYLPRTERLIALIQKKYHL
jgi:hypothetical protein